MSDPSNSSQSSAPPAVPEALNRMLMLWNERDVTKLRAHIKAALSSDVLFIDPANHVEGHDAFEEMVKVFRTRLPEAVCSRSSGVDSHHGLHRYHWEIHRAGERLVEGFDVACVDAQGKVSRVEGFFGPIPAR